MTILRRLLSALAQMWPVGRPRRYPHTSAVEAALKDWIPASGGMREAANENHRSKAAAP